LSVYQFFRNIKTAEFLNLLIPGDFKNSINHKINVFRNISLLVDLLVKNKVLFIIRQNLLFELFLSQVLHGRHVLEKFNFLLSFLCIKLWQNLLVINFTKDSEVAISQSIYISSSQIIVNQG
jgi:hypothetical protein